MNRVRHIRVIELEYRRALKAGSAATADWREMMAWASGSAPKGEYEWARWLDMAAGALVVWVNNWQASISAGRSPDAATLAKLEAHRDGLRALRSQLYLLSIANARKQLSELPERVAPSPSFLPPVPKQASVHQGSLL